MFTSIKKIVIGLFTIVRSMWMVNSHAIRPRDTILYPEEPVPVPPRFRGRIILSRDPDGDERCVACNLCAVACPVGCISLQKAEREDGRWYPEFFRINFSRCIFCGLCEEACPTTAIQMTPDFERVNISAKIWSMKKSTCSSQDQVNILIITIIV